jgi:hypothetical protein
MREEQESLLHGKFCAYLTCQLMGDPQIVHLCRVGQVITLYLWKNDRELLKLFTVA